MLLVTPLYILVLAFALDNSTGMSVSHTSNVDASTSNPRAMAAPTAPGATDASGNTHTTAFEDNRHMLQDSEDTWEMPQEDKDLRMSETPSAQTIAPFLTRHIPEQYNALANQVQGQPVNRTDTKYCYRHHPDLKCRRQADEPTMDLLQNVRVW